jgi:hypothetical protein
VFRVAGDEPKQAPSGRRSGGSVSLVPSHPSGIATPKML